MRLENRVEISGGTLRDERSERPASTRRTGNGSRVGEINEADLFEPASAEKNKASQEASHFKDVCEQMLADHVHRPKTRIFLQVVARMLGLTVARCISNVISFFTGQAWLEARRDYAILPMNARILNSKGEALKIEDKTLTAQELAERFKPRLYTISEDQATDESMKAAEIRYEVLPPREGKNSYSVIYYIRREREHMPIPLIGSLLDLLRPVLWATKSEWNAIEIDIDRDNGEPESLNYESCNYTGDPMSYEITSANDLNLPAKAVLRDKKWVHTLHQKDNRAKTHDIDNPFDKDTHPGFAFVNWNGGLDLTSATRLAGYQLEAAVTGKTRLYPMQDLSLKFLDIDTYRKEAIDLRNGWLKRRQTGHCYLFFPPRKDPADFKVVNLVSAQMPSLIGRAA